LKLYKGITLFEKGDWDLGIKLEKDRSYDGSISGDISLFKIRFWFRLGIDRWQKKRSA
jgi:hypothetical protein